MLEKMNPERLKISLIFCCLLLFSCSKGPMSYNLEGFIFDGTTKKPISSVLCALYASSPGLLGSDRKIIRYFETDGSGHYDCRFKPPVWKVNSYRIRIVKKSGYFDDDDTFETFINADEFKMGKTVRKDLVIFPEAFLKVLVKKQGVSQNRVHLSYYNEHWKTWVISPSTVSPDTLYQLRVVGNKWARIEWWVRRDGSIDPFTEFSDSVFCVAGEVKEYTVNY